MSSTHIGIINSENVHIGDNYYGLDSNNDLLSDLYYSLIKIQSRDNYKRLEEDELNDVVTDFLRTKGYVVGDQSRSGISVSGKKSGELDFTIRDTGKNGIIISIGEALVLSSAGGRSTEIEEHIDKLVNNYDTAGNKINFVIIYAKAKNFNQLWDKYTAHVDGLKLLKSTPVRIQEEFDDKAKIIVGKSSFKNNGKECFLYHYFVDMSAKSS